MTNIHQDADSSMAKSQITCISCRICRHWRWTASWERPVNVIHLLLICLPFLAFSSSQYICHISFSVVNHLYSIIFSRFANDNHWQSHFLFVHYSPQYPAKIWTTGLQKSYTGTLMSRTSHCPTHYSQSRFHY